MSGARRALVALATLLATGCNGTQPVTGVAGAPFGRVRVVDLKSHPVVASEAPIVARATLNAALVDGSGWTLATVGAALDAARTLLRERCAIEIEIPRLVVIGAPPAYRRLDAGAEARLYARLHAWRPRLLFVHATADNDVAYSYLRTSPVPQAGSAWFTRNVIGACAGQLIAHEIGHLAFNSAAHDPDPDNFMHPGCRASNLEGHPAVRIEPHQCARMAAGLKLLSVSPGLNP